MSVLNELPSKLLLEQAAAELAIEPAMVEKDWYVTQVLAFIATRHIPGYKIVFSGGTSLSKAQGLIKRFSEDIDFMVIVTEEAPKRAALSRFKNTVIDDLENAGFKDDRNSLAARDSNKFFSCNINYNTHFALVPGMRPHIQLEASISKPELPVIERPVESFITQLKKGVAEVAKIDCIDPVEFAADKLSALVWRIPKQALDTKSEDRSLVRHIHDLAMLENTVKENAQFPILVVTSLQNDNQRNKDISTRSNEEKFTLLLDTLSNNDKAYREAYDTFVKGISYASSDGIPDFDKAIEAIKRMINLASA